jgi:hypothetical protein
LTPQEAVALFGSQNKMAKAFGVTPPAILRWRKQGYFPRGREYQLPAALEAHRAIYGATQPEGAVQGQGG